MDPREESRPVPVVLADRYEGVRIALRERLEAAGSARVLAEAATVAEALAVAEQHPAAALVVGTDLVSEDLAGGLRPLLDGDHPVIVYGWLPADEHGEDLAGAAAVVGSPVVDGLLRALRVLAVP